MSEHLAQAVVLGAHGFVGRHVCRELASRGFSVIGLGHGHWIGERSTDWGLSRWVEGDADLATLKTLRVEGRFPKVVVHCAGGSAVSRSYEAPHRDFERSVDSTASMLEWIRSAGADAQDCRAVIISSAAVYGDHGDVDFTETSPHRPISPYGVHKLMAEQLCESYSRSFGLKISVVRLFSVYGEGLRKQLLWDALKKFSQGQSTFFGTGDELRDWIHVQDAARLLVSAALSSRLPFETYNGGHTHATTREVLTRLARAYESTGLPRFSGETHAGNPRRLTADGSRACDALGWKPLVVLADGLVDYVKWFRQLEAHDGLPRVAR